MRRWFLSYHSPDQTMAERLKTAIERGDTGSRVFFAPLHIRAGGLWTMHLAQEIAESTAFILLVGEKGLGPWQVLEYDEALERRVKSPDFPLIVVLLEGHAAPGLPFLRRLNWIVTKDPSSQKSVAQIMDAAAGGGSLPGELWRHTAPYRGLAAMSEADSDFFFGRGPETVEVIRAFEATPDKLPILLGNSGVGKSSLAQAGVLAAVLRQDWPETIEAVGTWPRAFNDSRTWCVLALKPGIEPVRALVEPFIRIWQFDPTDPRRETRQTEWTDSLIRGHGTLRGLLDATEERLQQQGRSKPPAFLLYVDQGEELYVRAEPRQRQRFSQVLAEGLADPRLRALMSLRADFFGELLNDEALQNVSRKIEVPPLREVQLREVVSKPAALLGARFETDVLAADIARRAAEESTKDAGALPLLSYLLDDMWTDMVNRGDGTLRPSAAAVELGSVLAARANEFLARRPESEDAVRRLMLKLASIREDSEPVRRRAMRSELTDAEWCLASELADHPNRLLVTATPEEGETYTEVAHEAIFRRWEKLREWVARERDFLVWRKGLEAAHQAWRDSPDRAKSDALLQGFPLTQAKDWLARRAEGLSRTEREFIDLSVKRTQRRSARRIALTTVLAGTVILGIGMELGRNLPYYKQLAVEWAEFVGPNMVLTANAEHTLQPGQMFQECPNCPEMVVLPAGEFMMGSPPAENRHDSSEEPQHKVTIGRPFAVSRFDVTFAEWDPCFLLLKCPQISDSGMGRGEKPAIDLTWDGAQRYVAWLSRRTGKPYRLLSEAEWEYAARAGTTTDYYWGEKIGNGNANCADCNTTQEQPRSSAVGSFKPNAFRLHDMAGNVWQWVQDCYHEDYNGAPTDGSAWISGDCSNRVIRGGSWVRPGSDSRSAKREGPPATFRDYTLGFRVARTLNASGR